MVTRPGTLQASFNSGEVAEELYARNDVKQFYASAAEMRNVEPVPQGGFRLLDRSRDLGAERGPLALIAGTLTTNASPAAGQPLATYTFAGVVDIAVIRFAFNASAAAAGAVTVEYRDAGGAWHSFVAPTFAARPTPLVRAAGRPPRQPVAGNAVRLVYTGAAGAVPFSAFELAAFTEAPGFAPAQYVPFTYAADQAYMMVVTSGGTSGVADVYRDGVFVGCAWHELDADQIKAMVPLQRLDTLFLFHPDTLAIRIMRQGGDHEWNTDFLPATEIPNVDLGGVYAKVPEHWALAFRWPSATTPGGYIFTVTVDGQDTTAIGIPTPVDWPAVAADLQGKLVALATVDPGVTVSVGQSGSGLQILDLSFAGGNAGSQFTVSAKFINTAEGGAVALRIDKGDPGGEPLFSASRGYPSCGLFYQDRLVQGGFKAKPGALLASPSADYFSGNIDVETASGGLLINMDTDGAERIQRLARSKHLVIFTSDAEYFVSDRVVRRDQPMNVVESSRNGSCPTAPICSTETSLLYVSKTRSLVYSATYDDVAQAYVSEPLSLLAKHLIKKINGAALQRANDDNDAARYFLVRDDGMMVVGLLIRSQDVTGFVRWITDGQVRAVAVDGNNRVYLSVERMVAGVAQRRVEWLEPGLLVDGAVTQTFGTPQTAVSGLSMHEGAAVWAIGDGWPLGPFTVAGGAITLPIAVSNVTVGRWTPPLATTLPLPRDVGPRIVLERPCRVHTVMVKVLGTTSIAIGANGEPPEDLPLYRAGMPTDLPQQPVSGWLELGGLEGWSIEGQVTITQVRPGPLQVTALVPQAKT